MRRWLAVLSFLVPLASAMWMWWVGVMPALEVPAFALQWAMRALAAPGTITHAIAERLFHHETSALISFLISTLFWFFPSARLLRWIGIYDPFANSDARRPHGFIFVAFIIDWFERRLFGYQKTGGWA
jgi:hypothetical protein